MWRCITTQWLRLTPELDADDNSGAPAVDSRGPATTRGGIMIKKHWTMILPGALLLSGSPAFGVELRDAVQNALNTNPEIRQAVSNRAATLEERVQGQGAYYPRISVEGSAGIRELRNPTRRRIGIADNTLYPIEGDL